MASQLLEVPFFLSLVVLATMFISIFFSMALLERFIPQLTMDAHANTSWLDGLRGMAVALVALNHAPLVIVNLKHVPQVFYFSGNEHELFRFFGSIGVKFYFVLQECFLLTKFSMFLKSIGHIFLKSACSG